MRNINWLLIFALATLAGALVLQHQSTRRLASELATLRQELAAPAVAQPLEAAPSRITNPGNPAMLQRLAALEQTVAQLARNADYLMDRGQLPLATNKLADLFAKFTDMNASDRERLQALQLLRRNRGLTDDAVLHAVNWLQSATNAGTREDILQQLEGLTNAALRGPLLALTGDANPDVREQAIDNLRQFVNDPQVESHLWKMINDQDEDIREDAMEALIEGPKSEARLASLRERALNANSTLDERLVAWRALRESNQDAPDMSEALAQLAQTSQDPFDRIKLFQAFDEAIDDRATPRDAAFLQPLLQGLQDPNPDVRRAAVEPLVESFKSNPSVDQWLRYTAQNDPDPQVRREASQAFINSRR